ncbi:DUF2255 family protein [Empedobacter brevis]|uniref:DUF2255 family protein n=1 Tax=Empedobacter brevis TaxID=247 RepID=UPI00289DC214|nr:DUF2255 family protein [Empedobacter brevis]
MNNFEKVKNYISTHNLIGLKAGLSRENFLDIWMVIVENRIFARSWGFAEKSWYNTFLVENEGELRCGDLIVKIKAQIPNDLNQISAEINKAYLDKYNYGDNSVYAKGIIGQEHVDKTMEFIVAE